jgi:phosphatidate cytidylyltransferase
MHRQRVVSALLLIPPFLLLVRYGTPVQFSLLVTLAIALGAWEFARLCPARGDPLLAGLAVVGAVAWHAALVWGMNPAAVGVAVAAGGLVRAMTRPPALRDHLVRAAWGLLGVVYVGGMLGTASLVRALPDGRQFVYYLVFTTWAADTAAYYVGSRFGRRPLAPAVSPRKTMEGAVAALVAIVTVAVAGTPWVWPRLTWAGAAAAGLLLGVAGIIGDLCESAVKRSAAVKDSGAIIPGHGGILDRLDSLMFACPVFYALVWLGWL